MNWYTADLHLGHRLVAEVRGYGPRDEPLSVDMHDQEIVDTWGDQVRAEDHVWILGDATVEGALSRTRGLIALGALPGTKHLVVGNHDSVFPEKAEWRKHWDDYVSVFATITNAERMKFKHDGEVWRVMMSHFPYAGEGDRDLPERFKEWRLRDEGRWLLHGHTHSSEKRTGDRQLHVGWDAWGRLVSHTEIRDIIAAADGGVGRG